MHQRSHAPISRPVFHFTPARNWINDPNGLIWFEGEYHLFYQYNPEGDVWGHISWGHAVSPDLVDWTELPVAIPEDDRDMIFSGGAVIDADNRSGLGLDGEPVLVAIYTGHARGEPARQTQNLAFSHDRGRTWGKYAGNPVLDLGLAHFRDPKVFWHAETGRWVMIVSLADRQRLSLFASEDLKAWRHLSDFGPAGAPGRLWECPDLFPLPTADPAAPVKWVVKVDIFEGGLDGGCGTQIFVGDFDGERFLPDLDAAGAPLWSWADHGRDFYAAITWGHLPAAGNRAVWLGWMSNHAYAAQTPTSPWRGSMTIPRELALVRRQGVWTLTQGPVEALEHLRGPGRDLADVADLSTEEGGLDLVGVLCGQDAGARGLELRWSSGDRVRVGFDRSAGQVWVDRSASGLLTDHPRFTPLGRAPWPGAEGDGVPLRLLVDASSIEVFVGDGEIVFTEQIFPRGRLETVAVFAEVGAACMRAGRYWRLRSSAANPGALHRPEALEDGA